MTKDLFTISSQEQATIDFYDHHAVSWVAKNGPQVEPSFWAPELVTFHEYLPAGKIIEIGFGGAREAVMLIDYGYTYTGIDPAQGLVALAQQQFPDQKFYHHSLFDYPVQKDLYDGFWCAAVLLHIPYDTIDIALDKLRAMIKTDGYGCISLACGQGEYFDSATG